jgi:hypothetical protein
MGLSGLQLIMSNGNLWKVVNNLALPRVGTSITGVNANGAQIPIHRNSATFQQPDHRFLWTTQRRGKW